MTNENWEEIHRDFGYELCQRTWKDHGFDYETTKQWKEVLGKNFKPKYYWAFCTWLRDERNLTPQEIKQQNNLESLKAEYRKFWTDIHSDFAKKNYSFYSCKTYRQLWEEKNLTYQDAKEWTAVGFELWDYEEVREWKNNNFTPQQTKSWLEIGIKLNEAYLAELFRKNNYQPSAITNLEEAKKEFNLVQTYLDKNYPCSCNPECERGGWTHQENCSRNVKDLNLRNLNLEGDLDLKGFSSGLKVYLTGNPKLGKIKNRSLGTELIRNVQERLNEKYPDKEQTKEIGVHKYGRLYNVEDGEVVLSEYPNLEYVAIDGNYLDVEKCSDPGLTKLEINSCPKLTRLTCYRNTKLTDLILNCPNLAQITWFSSGLTSLNVNNCPNLREISCQDNQQLNEIKLPLAVGEKLEKLDLSNNNFPEQDLSFFKNLVNLKELHLGNNKFYGSLEFLKNLTKLEKLDISNTDIDSGLEYLPDSLKEFKCSVSWLWKDKQGTKIQVIYDLFANEQGKVKTDSNNYIKNFPQKFQAWKEANPDLVKNAQEIIELEKALDNLNLALVNGKVENENTSKVLDVFQFETEERMSEMRKENWEYYQAQIIHNPPRNN